MKAIILLIIYVSATILACAGEGGDSGRGETATLEPGEIETGRWAARVTVPGGDIRFGLELGRAAGDREGYTATVLNGDERVPVREVSTDGPRLELVFPAFNSRIDAERKNGVLEGTLTLTKRGGELQNMPFRAEYAQGMTVKRPREPEIDVSGRWDVTFTDADGGRTHAVGEFHQEGIELNGTFLTSTGDYRYLSGGVTGRTVELSCFDGAHAFLFRATLDADGRLAGDFWSGTRWHETWTATQDETAALPDPFAQTALLEGYDRIEFRFPDTNGDTVSLDDERFDGRVVIVMLAGSWCPNCNDEAAFLADYYREHRSHGLEVVGLMYEHFRDAATARRQIARFADKHDIDFPLLHAGYSDKVEALETLPMLDRILSFPTTIFIDRSGTVRRIYTGFAGPGTGKHFESFKTQFEELVYSLLAQQ